MTNNINYFIQFTVQQSNFIIITITDNTDKLTNGRNYFLVLKKKTIGFRSINFVIDEIGTAVPALPVDIPPLKCTHPHYTEIKYQGIPLSV